MLLYRWIMEESQNSEEKLSEITFKKAIIAKFGLEKNASLD